MNQNQEKKLRILANTFRFILKLDKTLYFPIVELLDPMCELLPDFTYEVVTNDTFVHGIHADTNIKTGHIRIKESVYDGACNGNGRDRMTIAHELGHYFTLYLCEFKVQRNFAKKEIPAFADPEWQAKCFAGELMIPKISIKFEYI